MAVHIEERWSAAAWWCRRVAVFSVFLGMVAIIAHRLGYIETWPFLVALGLVAALALLAVLLAAFGFNRFWHYGDRGGRNLTIGLFLAWLVLTPFGVAAWLAYIYPLLNQATTDLEDPPVLARPDPQSQPVRPFDLTEITMHAQAYPDLTGRRYVAPIDQVAAAVETLMQQRGWPAAPSAGGTDEVEFTIHTVARLPVLALPYDVAIRLTDEGNATYIDMRAAARYGARDLGVDAWLIDGFLTDLDKQAGTLSGIVAPTPE